MDRSRTRQTVWCFDKRCRNCFHQLRDQHGVSEVHLLPCASNAACVIFGQAYDNYHPDMIVYDFTGAKQTIAPRLVIKNDGVQCVVRRASA